MAISRRQFTWLTGASVLGAQQRRPTAGEIIDRIRESLGVPWQGETLDGFKAGDAATGITGIATTAMATMDVLDRAVRARANLVLTLEPVFFGRGDGQGAGAVVADDPVLVEKRDFIRKNNLVVFRFSDHWRARKPDPFAAGLAQTMAWTKHQAAAGASRYDVPAVTLRALVDDLAERLKTRAGIRVVGDPQTRVSRLALLPGVSPLAAAMKALPDCDVVVAGEVREWESVEYAQDAVAAGQKKALVMLGRVVSEDPGMNVCAEWLAKVVPGTPARWLPVGDPYWRPA